MSLDQMLPQMIAQRENFLPHSPYLSYAQKYAQIEIDGILTQDHGLLEESTSCLNQNQRQ